MRIVVTAVVALFGVLTLSLPVVAAPCVSGSLQDYIGLAAGCTIGGATFSDFVELAPPAGATPISPTAIAVTPLGDPSNPGFLFGLNVVAGPGEFQDVFFGFQVADSLIGASLAMTDASASGDGSVTAIEDICQGAGFIGIACAGEATTLITFAVEGDSQTTEAVSFPSVSLLGVLVDFGIDGGLDGTGELGTATLTFQTARATPVPEPSSVALFCLATSALWLGFRSARPGPIPVRRTQRS